jgi:hypothetical protein
MEAVVWLVASKELISFKELFKEKSQGSKIKEAPTLLIGWIVGYFDGGSQEDGKECGVGVVLKLVNEIVFKLSLGCGISTNTKGGFLSLWCIFYFSHEKTSN